MKKNNNEKWDDWDLFILLVAICLIFPLILLMGTAGM